MMWLSIQSLHWSLEVKDRRYGQPLWRSTRGALGINEIRVTGMLIGVINYHFHSTLFIFSSLLPDTTTKQSLSGAETTNSHVQYQHLLLHNKYNNNISSSVQTLDAIFDGETTTQAFPVDIESTKTLGRLQDFIKRENPNYLRDVDARNERV